MLKNRGVYHIGIAVRSLTEGLALYRDQLGLSLEEEETLPERGLRVAILKGGNTEIELLESLSDDSAIGRFIAKRGPGIHHIAFEVENIEESLRQLKEQGVRLVDEVPRPGASQTKVAFLHPAGAGGVLVELVEKPKA
jgi:methylmalonyl-CoA/ethylmalonyl-CoA epimerase